MMTHVTTHIQIRRLLLIFSISFITTLMLIGGTLALHTPGFALSSFAHAMAGHPLFSSTCQSTKGAQPALCEHQDPQAQGCTADAQSIEVQDVFSRGVLIGEVNLRYSFTCKSFWTRTIAYARAEGIIQAVHARVTFNNATTEDRPVSPNLLVARAPVISFMDMTMGHFSGGSGVFDLLGQSQPLTIAL
jgi:Protein of unknown function (DUF2690)